MNTGNLDDALVLIDEEVEYFNASYFQNSILQEMSLSEIEKLLHENTEELISIASEMKQALSYIQNLERYDEAQQILLGASYNIKLMWLFLKKQEFIKTLTGVHQQKMRQDKDRGKEFLDEEQIKALIASVNIREIVGQYVKLPERCNKSHNIPCPFPEHNDKTGSFHIYDKTNSFYCYGCRRGGGIVQFLKHFKGISDKEAFKELFPQK